MIEAIITSKTRIKLLLKFFLNNNIKSYVRNLENEFGESVNGIRMELIRMEEAGLVVSETIGNRKYYKANTAHTLYGDIHNILLKYTEIDQVVLRLIAQSEDIDAAYITGELAEGNDSKIIDLLLVGENLDKKCIEKRVHENQKHITRKIRFMLLTHEELLDIFKDVVILPIWKQENVLTNKKNKPNKDVSMI